MQVAPQTSSDSRRSVARPSLSVWSLVRRCDRSSARPRVCGCKRAFLRRKPGPSRSHEQSRTKLVLGALFGQGDLDVWTCPGQQFACSHNPGLGRDWRRYKSTPTSSQIREVVTEWLRWPVASGLGTARVGSNPAGLETNTSVAQRRKRHPHEVEIVGSNPARGTFWRKRSSPSSERPSTTF